MKNPMEIIQRSPDLNQGDNFEDLKNEYSESKRENKTIEIAGLGKLEYVESIINFPENIIRETGGVKGYIRKKISLKDIEALGLSKANVQEIYSTLTDGNFPMKTHNHTFNFYGGHGNQAHEQFARERMLLQQISVSDSISEDGQEIVKYFPPTHLNRNILISVDQNTNQVKEVYNINDENWLREKGLKKDPDSYMVTPLGTGLCVSTKQENPDVKYYPSSNYKFFGFSTKNKAYVNYLDKAKNVYMELFEQLKTSPSYKTNSGEYFEESLKNLEDIHTKMEGFDGDDTWHHPRIPLVINKNGVPNLRWCHSSYASIPTEKSLNIIEMIT